MCKKVRDLHAGILVNTRRERSLGSASAIPSDSAFPIGIESGAPRVPEAQFPRRVLLHTPDSNGSLRALLP